jgi:hypothetical protein
VVSLAPNTENRKWSKAQKDNRLWFHDAMVYARKALNDHDMLNYYQENAKGMQTIWNV